MKVRKRFVFFFLASVALFVGLVFTAVSVIDSPAKMQLRKNDSKRISDLKEVANILLDHHREGKALAENIAEATKSNSTRNFMRDLVSDELYDYRRISEYAFELCANFETSNIDYGNYQSFYFANKPMNLGHSKGKYCFDFDVREGD